jgi:hypothetical protein
LHAVVDSNPATKQETALIRRPIKDLETRLRHEMKEKESHITLHLGGLIVAGDAVLAALIEV